MMSFMEEKRGHENGGQREKCGSQGHGSIVPARCGQHQIGDDRSQNETDTEGSTDETQALRTILFVGAIGHRGLRGGHIRTGESINDARKKKNP